MIKGQMTSEAAAQVGKMLACSVLILATGAAISLVIMALK